MTSLLCRARRDSLDSLELLHIGFQNLSMGVDGCPGSIRLTPGGSDKHNTRGLTVDVIFGADRANLAGADEPDDGTVLTQRLRHHRYVAIRSAEESCATAIACKQQRGRGRIGKCLRTKEQLEIVGSRPRITNEKSDSLSRCHKISDRHLTG